MASAVGPRLRPRVTDLMQEDVGDAIVILLDQIAGIALKHHPVSAGIGGGVMAGTIAGYAPRGAAEQGQGLGGEIKALEVAGVIVITAGQGLGGIEHQPLALGVQHGLVAGADIDAAVQEQIAYLIRQPVHGGERQGHHRRGSGGCRIGVGIDRGSRATFRHQGLGSGGDAGHRPGHDLQAATEVDPEARPDAMEGGAETDLGIGQQ